MTGTRDRTFRGRRLAIWLSLFFVCTGLTGGGQEAVDGPRCPLCKTTGKIPNPVFEAHQELVEGVQFCSWLIETDKKGCGVPYLPCENCRNPTLKAKAQAHFQVEVDARLKWLAERREIDTYLKVEKPLLHLKTEHFLWVWNIPKLTYKKKNYRSHEALHLYAGRMEEFFDEFLKVHKIEEADNHHNLHQLFCFEREVTGMRACTKYGGQASPSGKVTLQGVPSIYVIWWNKSLMPSEEDFHRNLIHNVAHLFVSVYKKPFWIYHNGFAYEGIAHWWEIFYDKKATSVCFQEINSLFGWVSTKWQAKVKKAVLAGKNPSLYDMLDKNGGSLDAVEHVYAWSFIDYMMFMDTRKTLDFFLVLKDKRPPREAFLEVWGRSVPRFQEDWTEYVKKEYSVQEDNVPLRAKWRR